jgi:hypothetical protein
VSPRAEQVRGPGAEVLRLLSYGSVRVLPELADRSRRPSRIEVPSSTFHHHAAELLKIDAITRHVVPGPPRQVVYELGPSGFELCELLAGWRQILRAASPGVDEGELDWEAPRRFARGWVAGIVPALLDEAHTIGEVELLVRPSRRLTGNQVAGLLGALTRHRFLELLTDRYAITDLGRTAIGELAASARFERTHIPEAAIPITAEDGANALRGTLPLITLPDHPGGICEFVVRGGDRADTGVAMAWAEVKEGRVIATGLGPAPRPPATWAQGSIDEWLSAVIDHRPKLLKPSGEQRLGKRVLDQLHSRLYGSGG